MRNSTGFLRMRPPKAPTRQGNVAFGRKVRIAGTTPRGDVCDTREASSSFRLELDLLRQAQRIVDLDPEIADRTLDLGMSEKQLDRSQIAGLAVDLRRLGAT